MKPKRAIAPEDRAAQRFACALSHERLETKLFQRLEIEMRKQPVLKGHRLARLSRASANDR